MINLTIIPAERGFKMKDEAQPYEVVPRDLVDDPQLP